MVGKPKPTDRTVAEFDGVKNVEGGALFCVVVHQTQKIAVVFGCWVWGRGEDGFFSEAEGMAVPGFDFMGLRVQL